MAEKTTSNKELPLAGVVLCFTSILPEQRTDLATNASQMGATHKFDLTSDVTHLLVGEVNTPKYKFVARERADVVVLKPEWVEAVRQAWMQGEDTDIRALEQQYKLLTFTGLSICLTGFEDSFRSYVQSTATANGAEFRKDLTKSVTHLVALSPEGQKYKFATQWNIKVVSAKWFNDSIERGMVLEETLYHPLLSEEQQGVGAWNKTIPPPKEKPKSSENTTNPRPRKLRRIASAKLGDQNEGIWGDIVGTGFDNSDTKAPKSNGQSPANPLPPKAVSVIQEAKSFASDTTFAEAPESYRQPSESIPNDPNGFLHGCYFFIHGFSQKQRIVLRYHLSFNGAQLVDSLSDFSRLDIPKTGHGLYIILSHKTPKSEIPSTDDLAFECEVVTDMWLERCLGAKALVPPEAHVASTPIPKFPIPEFHGMRICSTGFSGIDLLHLSKLVSLIGATYNEYLTPNASVLICNGPHSGNLEKLRHTHEWGVPAVSAEWLWISIQAGQKKSLDPYIVQKPLSRSSSGNKAIEKRNGSHAAQEHHSQHPTPENGDTQPATGHDNAVTKPSHDPPQRNTTTKGQRNPIPGDGFTKEQPEIPPKQSTIPESRTPSPTKPRDQDQDQDANQPADSAPQSAFTLAVSGLLKQARAAKSRSSASDEKNNTHDPNNNSNVRQRRRKPLTGKGVNKNTFSRASSIDTLNDDGYGSAIDSLPSNSRGPSRANSRSGPNHSFTTTTIDTTRFDDRFLDEKEDEAENQTPAMTQLNYEDPDAVAMREQLLNYAGKLGKQPAEKGSAPSAVVGEIRELEDLGWGTGRRTRNAGKAGEE